MSKIADFYKSNKYAILWTAAYIAIMWLVLMFMFNFNIFSVTQWQMLAHAHIHGFAGFVFGILILAAIPMYIATTILIMRTQQPIITINTTYITKIFNAVFPRPEAPVTPEIEVTPATTPEPDTNQIPSNIPNELRGAFIRARQHIDQFSASAFNPPPAPMPVTENKTNTGTGELPLPVDFDFDDDTDATTMPIIEAPTFTDIDFGDNDDAEYTDDTDIAAELTPDNTPGTPAPDANTQSEIIQQIIQYLDARGKNTTTEKDMILTDEYIIAIHDDADFWIADPENWFAAGKQKPSPIIDLIKESAGTGLKPIIYLAQTNIMDIDNVRTQWEQMGVISITDLNQLPV